MTAWRSAAVGVAALCAIGFAGPALTHEPTPSLEEVADDTWVPVEEARPTGAVRAVTGGGA